GRGDNAPIMISLVERLRGKDGTAVVDESIHTKARRPSLARELFGFPIVLGVLQALIALVIVVWAGLGRFGRPEPVAVGLARGKTALIDNIADLLRIGGHAGPALARY